LKFDIIFSSNFMTHLKEIQAFTAYLLVLSRGCVSLSPSSNADISAKACP